MFFDSKESSVRSVILHASATPENCALMIDPLFGAPDVESDTLTDHDAGSQISSLWATFRFSIAPASDEIGAADNTRAP